MTSKEVGRLLENKEIYLSVLCVHFPWPGYINPPKSACLLTYTTRMSRDISAISVCFRVVCVLQSECLQNCQATLDSINDLYVHSQCSCLRILNASVQLRKEEVMWRPHNFPVLEGAYREAREGLFIRNCSGRTRSDGYRLKKGEM